MPDRQLATRGVGALICVLLSLQPAAALDGDRSSVVRSELSGPLTQAQSTVGLELSGDLRPKSAADVAFKVAGQLLSVKVERGQAVKKGQVIAVLSESEANAQVMQSEALLAQARAQLDLAKDNEARAQTLVAANAAPDSQAVAVRLQSEIARAAVAQASAARDLAWVNLVNHQLKAPFDGVIVKVPDGTGQIVAAGAPLFRIEALETLVLRTTIAESDLERVGVGDDVSVEANGGQKVMGKVRVVLRSLDSSRRAPVEIDVPNAGQKLSAGSYVRAICAAR